MANVVAAALNDAKKSGRAKTDFWIVRFITGDGQVGLIDHISDGIFRMTANDKSIFYFDASKVLFVQPAE